MQYWKIARSFPDRATSHNLRLQCIPHLLRTSTTLINTMARRSKGRHKHRPPRFVWRRSDVLKVLACLDYSLEQGVDFNNTAIGHLARGTGKKVTAKLIRQALWNEYKTYGREEGNDTFEDFLSEGSPFLHGYTDRDRENIREEISRIEPPQSRYWLRNTPLKRSPSQSRTQSSNHCQRSETSTLSLHSTPEFEGISEYVDRANDEEKRRNGKQVRNVILQVQNPGRNA